MARHTPEPWRIEGRYIMGLKVKAISEIPQYGVREAWVDRANRRRIVACVNACAGLSNKALEAGMLKEALGAWMRRRTKRPAALAE